MSQKYCFHHIGYNKYYLYIYVKFEKRFSNTLAKINSPFDVLIESKMMTDSG